MKRHAVSSKVVGLLALLGALALVGCGDEEVSDDNGGQENNADNNAATNNAGNNAANNAANNNTATNNAGNNAAEPTEHEIRLEGGMAYIPLGDFWMGCNEAIDTRCRDNEKPQHKVLLDAFWIDALEVTVAQYRECVDAGSCMPPYDYAASGGFCNYGGPVHDNHPVTCIKIAEAQAYCGWKGKRLPSEAEWEKAARGGCEGWGEGCQAATPLYPWGNDLPTCDRAMFTPLTGPSCAQEGTGPFGTLGAVGGREAGASPYGVQDMAGGVWEWTQDTFSATYYANSPEKNPLNTSTDGQQEEGLAGFSVRGGGFSDQEISIRASARNFQPVHDGIDYLGFRCARGE
jgi:formylglycine-generating enzyme required for sulfatase activity